MIGQLGSELEHVTVSSRVPSFPAHSRLPRRRIAAIGVIAILSLVIPAGAAAGDPTGCADSTSPVFSAWGDSDLYRLIPGGDFEDPAADWALSDGAAVIDGSAPIGGSSVLSMPSGSSALSAPICMDGSEPHARLFAKTDGNFFRAGRVLVEAVAPEGNSVAVGIVRGGSDWKLSSRFLVPAWWVARDGIDSFQYRFTALGANDSLIDDVYVDPRARW